MAQLASAHAWPAVVTTLAGKGTLIIKNNGDWRSWLARMHGVHEVTGSSPVSPTNLSVRACPPKCNEGGRSRVRVPPAQSFANDWAGGTNKLSKTSSVNLMFFIIK